MKNLFKIFTLALVVLSAFACQEEELRVKYAESYPVFDQCKVMEDSITYNDSITLQVQVSDTKTPLSTLEIKVVVNDEIIASEVVRTKDNVSTYNKKYLIPFQPRMPHMADVEVHLKSINVEGYATDTIVYNCKAYRKLYPSIWFVTSLRATTTQMTLRTDTTAPYIYEATGDYNTNDLSFRLATLVNSKTKKVDFTGDVFGTVNGKVNYIYTAEDPWIRTYDPTLFKIKKVVIDLYNLTAKAYGDPLVPATSLSLTDFADEPLISVNNLGTGTATTWKTNSMYLGANVEMTFNDITNLTNTLNPDFFEVTGSNTAKFLGETAIYKVYWHPNRKYLTVERPEAVYPDALWMVGVGLGWPNTPLTKSTSWNWTTPEEYIYCKKVSPGIFKATIFANHESDNAFTEYWRHQFSIKIFYQRGWGDNPDKTLNEGDANKYTLPAILQAQSDGNWGGSDAFLDQPGVYEMVFNLNTKTTTMTKVN